MKIPLNLASQPFRRDRAVVVASLVVALLLVATLAWLLSMARSQRQQLAGMRREVASLNAAVQAATAGDQRLEAVMHQPQNATVLELSVFINNLIYHKAVSWSRMFTDLESVIPYNVKILNLHPSLNSENQLQLDMTVGTESPEAVSDLLKALESSPIFGPVYQHSTLPPTQAEPLYRSRITVPYEQKL